MLQQQSIARADRGGLLAKSSHSVGSLAKSGSCNTSMRLRMALACVLLSHVLQCASAIDMNAVEYLPDPSDTEEPPALGQLEQVPDYTLETNNQQGLAQITADTADLHVSKAKPTTLSQLSAALEEPYFVQIWGSDDEEEEEEPVTESVVEGQLAEAESSEPCARGDYMCSLSAYIDSAKSSILDSYDSAVTYLYSGSASNSQENRIALSEEGFNGESAEVQLSPMRNHMKYVQQAAATSSGPMSQANAILLVVFSFLSIFACCASTTVCVRVARDCNIAMNAANIRKQYQRNMQLYCIMKEKNLIDIQHQRQYLDTSYATSQTSGHSASYQSQAYNSSCEIIPERGADEEDSQVVTPGPGQENNVSFSEQQSIILEKEKSMRSSILEEQLSLATKVRTNDSMHGASGRTEKERAILRGSYEKGIEREPLIKTLSRSQMGADGMQLSHLDANINVSILQADAESSEQDKHYNGQEGCSSSEHDSEELSQDDNFQIEQELDEETQV